MPRYIVTVTAADRVGIVSSVAGTIRDAGGNIVELSQTVMRGFFTLICEVEFDKNTDPTKLAAAVREHGKAFELTVAVIDSSILPAEVPVPNGERFILTVLGGDSPGNIHGVANCLAMQGVNIVDMHARTDGKLFSFVMEAFLPPHLSPVSVRADLERFGRDHGLEAYVQHENIFLATSEPTPVRVGPDLRLQGDSVVPH